MLQATVTVDEAARFLRRTPRTIRDWIASGRIKARKIGRSYVIPETEVRKFVEVAPTDEVREYDPDRRKRLAELRGALSGFSMEKFEDFRDKEQESAKNLYGGNPA